LRTLSGQAGRHRFDTLALSVNRLFAPRSIFFSTSADEIPSPTREENVSTQPAAKLSSLRNERELHDARFAMRISLIVGLVMLGGKATAYLLTHSAAIFPTLPNRLYTL
jgi:hypothetical protein